MICNLKFIKKRRRITWNATLRAFWLWFSAEFAITRTMTAKDDRRWRSRWIFNAGKRTRRDLSKDLRCVEGTDCLPGSLTNGPGSEGTRRRGDAIERENLFSTSIFLEGTTHWNGDDFVASKQICMRVLWLWPPPMVMLLCSWQTNQSIFPVLHLKKHQW